MAVNPQNIWTTREFGIGNDLSPVPSTGSTDRHAMDRPRFRVRRPPGSDHHYFSGDHQQVGEPDQTGREGHHGGADRGRTDRSPFGGTDEDLRAEFRDYQAERRDQVAAEAAGEGPLNPFLSWLRHTFWFVRKEAYPEFDEIMSEARAFAKNPDATMIPLVLHPPRRNWADKVLTGEEDET